MRKWKGLIFTHCHDDVTVSWGGRRKFFTPLHILFAAFCLSEVISDGHSGSSLLARH